MKLPIFKYYLAAPFSLKARLYLTQNKDSFLVERLSLETSDRPCLECLIYSTADACNPTLIQCVTQVLEWMSIYLAGKQPSSLPPLLWDFSPFAKKVLTHLAMIPFGERMSYQGLAEVMGHPKAARAVGNALNKNPFPLILPCHRIVAKEGLGGFAYPLSLKQMLLDFETT